MKKHNFIIEKNKKEEIIHKKSQYSNIQTKIEFLFILGVVQKCSIAKSNQNHAFHLDNALRLSELVFHLDFVCIFRWTSSLKSTQVHIKI